MARPRTERRSIAPGHPPALPAFALHAASVATPVTVLLFWRAEIAARLGVVGTLVGEMIIVGVAAVIGAWMATRTRSALPAGLHLLLGTIASTVGLALMAWTIQLNLFVVGAVLYALGAAPALVLHRPLLAMAARPDDRFRTMSWYWAAVSSAAALPLVWRIVGEPGPATALWVSFGLQIAAVVVLAPHLLVHDEDRVGEGVSMRFDTPWPRRSILAAGAVGFVLVGGAQPARLILIDEWQRSPRQLAAVLSVAAVASAAINVFGPWYHRLDRLDGSRRADAIGIQLIAAGALTGIGALSFTYIGLIVCWATAGGALGLAATGLDAAAFASVDPEVRRRLGFVQVGAFAAGAGIGLVMAAVLPFGPAWRLAILAVPLVAAGWSVRRYADSASATAAMAASPVEAQLPRRVAGLDGSATPVLAVESLDVAYGSVQVLFGVDLTVEPGQIVALLGTNGAGKTTLFRAISGLEPSTGGRIVFAGLDITQTRPTWRVGMGLHQIVGGDAVVATLTVAENLRLFTHSIDRLDGDSTSHLLAEVFEVFPRLAERRDQRADTLSGGERQMLALAKALIVQPRLLLIDEFSLGLAPVVVAELLPVVRTLADRGSAVLIVEQSVNVALSIADYAYVIEKGAIGYEGSAAELRATPDLVRSAYLEGLSQALAR